MATVHGMSKKVCEVARDGAYVAVGLGVLAVKRAEAQRQEVQRRLSETDPKLEDRVQRLQSELGRRYHEVDGVVEGLITHVESSLEPLEDQLPTPARDVVRQAHDHARALRAEIRNRMPAA